MELTPEQIAKLEPSHPLFVVLERMKKVEEKMNTADPEISTHMKAIWQQLQEYDDLAHLLSPQQIGVLMKGLQKHTGISLVVEDKKRPSKSKKITADDLL